MAAVGNGCPDLVVGCAGINLLVEVKDPEQPPSARRFTPQQKKWHAEFGDTWVWLSLVLFVVALGVIVGVALPALEQLVAALRGGSADSSDRVKAALGKVMGASSVASVAYVVIIVLMVTKPGS